MTGALLVVLVLIGLGPGCNLVFGTDALSTATDGEASTETSETGKPVERCGTTPKASFNTGAPNATVAALIAVDDDPEGSVVVIGTTLSEVDLGGACGSMKLPETAGFVARFRVDGECIDAAMLSASGGFTSLAADYNSTTGELAVGGIRGIWPHLFKGPIDDLSALDNQDPTFDVGGRIRALDLRDDDTIVATGDCFGSGVLLVDGVDVQCVSYPNTVMSASGIVANGDGVFVAGSYSSTVNDPLPSAPDGSEAVFVARVTGADLALKRVDSLNGTFPTDDWNRLSVSLAARGSSLAVAAVLGPNLKVVEYDTATLSAGSTKEFISGCEQTFASDLLATPNGWVVAGGGLRGDTPGCRVLGLWESDEVVGIPLANPATDGTRPQIAAGCFGIAAAMASPSTLYIEYLTP